MYIGTDLLVQSDYADSSSHAIIYQSSRRTGRVESRVGVIDNDPGYADDEDELTNVSGIRLPSSPPDPSKLRRTSVGTEYAMHEATARNDSLTLPNELLFHIFEELMGLFDDRFDASRTIIRDMSLVCRRFREIILGFTPVWTNLDLDVCHDETLELMLARSKEELLSVRFKHTKKSSQAVFRALQEKDRWCYLSAELGWSSAKTLAIISSMVFPFVKTLQFRMPSAGPGDELIYSIWTFPCVEHVEMVDTAPLSDSFHRENMKTFKFISRPGGRMNSDISFVRRLATFLRPAANLQTLYLDLAYVYYPGWISDAARMELPNVTEFCVSNWRRGGRSAYNLRKPAGTPLHLDMLTRIIRAMRMPNLRYVSISVAIFEDDLSLSDWLSLAFPPSPGSCPVTSLEFNIMLLPSGRTLPQVAVRISAFFDRFPALRSLSIDAEFCLATFPYIDLNLTDLKVLCISNCENSTRSLYDIVHIVVKCGAALEEIKIRSKHDVHETELKSIAPNAVIEITRA